MDSIIKGTAITILIAAAVTSAAGSISTNYYDINSSYTVEQSMFTQSLRNEVLDETMKFIGFPYVWGGDNPQDGFDCSGLVKHVYKNIGICVPRVADDQLRYSNIISKDEARLGDLIFFGDPAYHVGIWLGNDTMIHSPKPGEYIRIDKVGNYDDVTFGRYIEEVFYF